MSFSIRAFALTMLVTLCSAFNAAASGLDCLYDYYNGTLTVSGSLGGGGGLPVTVSVFKPSYSLDNAISAGAEAASPYLEHFEAVYSDSSGNVKAVFPVSGNVGTYNVYVTDGEGNKADGSYIIYSAENRADVLVRINGASAEAISAIISEDGAVVGLLSELFKSAGVDRAAIGSQMLNRGFKTPEDVAEYGNPLIVKGYIKSAPGGSQISVVLGLYETESGLNLTDYKALTPEKAKLSADKFSSLIKNSPSVGLQENLDAAIALTLIYKADSWWDIAEILNKYQSRLGISPNNFGALATDVYRAVYGVDFADVNALNVAVTAVLNKNPAPSGVPGVGGGGGTGGGGGGFVTDVTLPINSSAENAFSDMNDYDWAVTAVNELKDMGIVNGDGNGNFRPGDNVTREEFLKMLLWDNVISDARADFSDVSENAWYYKYVAAGVKAGIINGYSDGTFGVGKLITRQEMAAMVYRTLKAKGKSVEINNDKYLFSDDGDIADYAKEAVYALRTLKIVSGMGDNSFMPENNAVRAQAAVIIHNCVEKEEV